MKTSAFLLLLRMSVSREDFIEIPFQTEGNTEVAIEEFIPNGDKTSPPQELMPSYKTC